MTPPPRLTVVLPTFNEAQGLPSLVEKIKSALADVAHEIIVVDDSSPDGTAAVARGLVAIHPHLRCLKRVGRKGLSGACIEGMMAASAPVVAVMDADGQHDEAKLTEMLARIEAGDELVVATRYSADTGSGGFSKTRAWGSRLATAMARGLLRRPVSDPMSGYFMLSRDLADRLAPTLSREGFKVLFDILSQLDPKVRIAEVPYTFRSRFQGESKLGALVTLQFLALLISRFSGGRLSTQFVLFGLIGSSGLIVHLAVLYLLTVRGGTSFAAGQVAATLTAMASNFFLNNWLTYAHRRLHGWRLLTGLITFCAICSVGAIANIGVASWIYGFEGAPILAGLAGALMGAIFNYAVTKTLIWREV